MQTLKHIGERGVIPNSLHVVCCIAAGWRLCHYTKLYSVSCFWTEYKHKLTEINISNILAELQKHFFKKLGF